MSEAELVYKLESMCGDMMINSNYGRSWNYSGLLNKYNSLNNMLYEKYGRVYNEYSREEISHMAMEWILLGGRGDE